MFRRFAVATVLLSCAMSPGWSQSASVVAERPAAPAGNTVLATKTTPNGHCAIGVVSIVGILFQVQKIGFGSFGNEYHRVRVDDWGYDDLVVSRVRAAASRQSVQRIQFNGREELARKTFAKRQDPIGFGARLAEHLSNPMKSENFEVLKDFEVPAAPEAVTGNNRLRDGARAMVAAKLDKELPAYLNDNSSTR